MGSTSVDCGLVDILKALGVKMVFVSFEGYIYRNLIWVEVAIGRVICFEWTYVIFLWVMVLALIFFEYIFFFYPYL